MAKGAAIKFESYEKTIPKILRFIHLPEEIKKYDKIVLKPKLNSLNPEDSQNTNVKLIEQVLLFCLEHKNPVSEVFIAEGADGFDTSDLFEELGYRDLAEKYNVGLVDLNNADVEGIRSKHFLKFDNIPYPKILKDSFVISIPAFTRHEEYEMSASLPNMLGAFSSKYYSGFFSLSKNKIRKHPIKFSIHDIIRCKMPDMAIIDASKEGYIFAGIPFEMDKQIAKLIDKHWEDVEYLSLIDESFLNEEEDALEEEDYLELEDY